MLVVSSVVRETRHLFYHAASVLKDAWSYKVAEQ